MPAAQPLTIHIFSAIAEHERTLISQRTASALMEKKKRGEKLGSPQNFTQDARKKGPLRMKHLAQVNLNNIKARKTAKLLRNEGETLAVIATELNEAGFKSSKGKTLSPIQIQRLLMQQ